jgi:hypothetical protein
LQRAKSCKQAHSRKGRAFVVGFVAWKESKRLA